MSLYDQHIQAVNTRTSSEWALDKIVHLHEEIFRALERLTCRRAARYSTIITARWIAHAAPDGKAYKSMPHTG